MNVDGKAATTSPTVTQALNQVLTVPLDSPGYPSALQNAVGTAVQERPDPHLALHQPAHLRLQPQGHRHPVRPGAAALGRRPGGRADADDRHQPDPRRSRRRRRGPAAPAAPEPHRPGPARRRARRPGADRAPQLVHHLQPGGAVEQQPGGHDPGPGRGHPGRRRPAQPSLGLDHPLLVQYWNWLVQAVHGNLGRSYFTQIPVSQSIGQRLPVDLSIAVLAVILAVIIGGAPGRSRPSAAAAGSTAPSPRRARRCPRSRRSWSASSWWSCSPVTVAPAARPTATSGPSTSVPQWLGAHHPAQPGAQPAGRRRHRPAAAHLPGRGAGAELHRRRQGPRPALPAHPGPARAAQRGRARR